MAFQKLSKTKTYVRLALQGPAGAGKTWTSMAVADELAKLSGKRACVIDTEHGSAAKYAKDFPDIDGDLIVGEYQPKKLVAKIRDAVDAGYGACIVDSVTHFWIGPKGFLEMVDEEVLRMRSGSQRGDSHSAWKKVDKDYQRFIQDLLSMPIHLILCMRAKQKTERKENGKVEKIGLDAQMRQDFEYEFDIEGMIDMDHNLVIGKNRTGTGLDGKIFHKPGADFARILHDWCQDGDGEFSPVVPKAETSKPESAKQEPPKQPALGARPPTGREHEIGKTAAEIKAEAARRELEDEDAVPVDYDGRYHYFVALISEATNDNIKGIGDQIRDRMAGAPKPLTDRLRKAFSDRKASLSAPPVEEPQQVAS